jgi:hypothetical protein
LFFSKSYNCIFAHFICLSSPKANDWTAIRDGNNNRLSIGEFSFKKKGISSYTEANNARDIIAMLLSYVISSVGGLSCHHGTFYCHGHRHVENQKL